jgi:hypothetical protein
VNLQPGFFILDVIPTVRNIPGGGICFRLYSGCQKRIKSYVRVLPLGGTENGGRCPSIVIENRTGDILSRLGVCNNRDKLSYRDDELVSF